MAKNQVKKQTTGTNARVAHIFTLADKNFKITVIHMFKNREETLDKINKI